MKLSDGGLTDNFGLSGLVIARAAADEPYAPLPRDKAIRLRRVVFIVVNAGLHSKGDWARTIQGPSGAEMLDAITDTAMNSAVRSGFDAFRLTLREWEDQTRKWRCRLPTSEVARFGVAADWRCSAISFDIVELSFDQLDAERAERLANVKTSLQLPSEEVDLVVDAGINAVLAHPGLVDHWAGGTDRTGAGSLRASMNHHVSCEHVGAVRSKFCRSNSGGISSLSRTQQRLISSSALLASHQSLLTTHFD